MTVIWKKHGRQWDEDMRNNVSILYVSTGRSAWRCMTAWSNFRFCNESWQTDLTACLCNWVMMTNQSGPHRNPKLLCLWNAFCVQNSQNHSHGLRRRRTWEQKATKPFLKDVLYPALFELAKLGGARKPVKIKSDSALASLAQDKPELQKKYNVKIAVLDVESLGGARPHRKSSQSVQELHILVAIHVKVEVQGVHPFWNQIAIPAGVVLALQALARTSRSDFQVVKTERRQRQEQSKNKFEVQRKAKTAKRSRGRCFWVDEEKTVLGFSKFIVVQTLRARFSSILHKP